MENTLSSSTYSETDVLIVGAGPVGLTMACELRRRGIRSRIIDKAAAPGTSSRANGMHPRTLEVLDYMGIAERMTARGLEGVGFNVYNGDKLLLHMHIRLSEKDPTVPYPGTLLIPQNVTEQVFIEFLQELGGTVERSQELVDLQQDANTVSATIRNTNDGTAEEIRAKWLVGTDGAHSRVRKALGFTFEGSTYAEEFLIADVDLDWDKSRDEIHIWMHHDGQFAAMPYPNNHWRLIADVASPDGKEIPRASLELFQQLMRERAGDTTTTISNPIWFSNFQINRRMVSSYRQGRVFLAGDAAHVHSPFGGQGMNTGIQDAYNLAWKLALVLQGKAAEVLLDTYQEERLPIAREVLHSTHRNTSFVFSTHPVIQFMRDHVVVPALNLSALQQQIVKSVNQLGVNYRTSSLSQSYEGTFADKTLLADRHSEKPSIKDWLDFRKAPKAGDRAPDGHCLLYPSQTPTSLFEQFRGTTSTLLLFDGLAHTSEGYAHLVSIARKVEAALGANVKTCIVVSANEKPASLNWDGHILLDPQHELHTTYGAGAESLYFIRPDGYVGFRSQPVREEHLFDYLGNVFTKR